MLFYRKIGAIRCRNFKCAAYIILSFFICGVANADALVTHAEQLTYQDSFLYLKEKKLNHHQKAPVIILLNSVGIPSVDAFDVVDYSLMSHLAHAGYDVWGIDFINQGHAGRSKKQPLYAKNAVQQLHAALQYIYKVTGNKNGAILGWSWGSLVGAKYAIDYPTEVNHLILDAAMYSSPMPKAQQENSSAQSIPEKQEVPWAMVEHHWKTMLPQPYQVENRSAMQAAKKTYCHIENQASCTVTRLKSQKEDLIASWTGKPLYDASKITTPTLVIYGGQDFFADPHLFEKLINTPYKEQVVINNASHWLLYENKRTIFYQSIVNFLNIHE